MRMMNSLLDQWLYRLKCKCKYKLKRLKCLLTDHDVSFGQYAEECYCRRCGMRSPEDRLTLFRLLNHRYCWLVSKEWNWFDRLDEWLCEKYRMPRWWEY